jgi:molybdate transport system regulatory protein
MLTSARNQFQGTVSAIKAGPVNAEVDITVGDDTLAAVVTHDSVVNLGLKIGAEAYAMVKASWVIIAPENGGMRFSTRNRLCGKITQVIKGMVNSEVLLALDGGSEVSAIVTNESVVGLGLAEGVRACALFKATSVILGVKA